MHAADAAKLSRFSIFLDALTELKTLKVNFDCDDFWDEHHISRYEDFLDGSFQNLIDRIAPIHNRIEVLDLGMADGADMHHLIHYLLPVHSFTALTRLRKLSVSQAALFGDPVM